MAGQPDDKHWFVSLNGKRYGPFTFSALTEAASRGVINPDTVVWRLGWVRWHRAGSVPGLIDKVSAKAEQPEARPETARQTRTVQAKLPEAPTPIVERPAERPSARVQPTSTRARIEEEDDRQPDEEDYGKRRRRILEKYRVADEDDDELPETERDEHDVEEEEEAPRRTTKDRRTISARPTRARDEDDEEEEIVEQRATSARTRRAAEPTALADEEDADEREDEETEREKDRRRSTLKRRQGQRAASLGRGLRDDGVDDRVEDHDEDEDDRDTRDREDEEELQPVLRRLPSRDGRRRTPNLRLVRPSDDETDTEDEAEPDRNAAPAIKMQRRAPTGPIPDLPPQIRGNADTNKTPQKRGGGFLGLIKRVVITFLVIVLLGAIGYGTYWSGIVPKLWHLRQGSGPKPQEAPSADVMSPASLPTTPMTDSGLPRDVATLPAVATLAQNDPAAFKRFVARFTAAAVNVPNDAILSVARNALRKSLKKLLANAPPDVLLDITDIYLTYMKTLQASNAESCVALSDESKGAKLTANLAKDFPMLFVRDMTTLDKIAATDPKAVAAAPTAEEARPLIQSVFNALSSQPVQRDLLQREKLAPQEFSAYCDLVVAFYGAVLALPEADKVKLLRYLYATAAADDDDPSK